MNLSLHELRKRHPSFIYHSYKFVLEKGTLRFSFHFEIVPGISFFPEVRIMGIKPEGIKRISRDVLNNFAFHLGLAEIPSYWKSTCSAEIIIKTGFLDTYQRVWWKDLFTKGLGEFFYLNNIDYTSRDFLIIKTDEADNENKYLFTGILNPKKYLVPVGGGKDSALTLALLKKNSKEILPFCLNPVDASLQIIKMCGLKNPVIAVRKIDDKLLNLNKSGYLNGHTPFSAYLAFLSSLVALVFDIKSILVANGRSANEGNTLFNEDDINHQYSKSFEFENKFRNYSKKYLAKNLEFTSFLRPLYELQIAKIFANFSVYFPFFKSCNRGQKTNSWCQNCSKCLFVYTILYPFIEKKVLTAKIFSEDLFEKKELLPVVGKFLEYNSVKPFDCVGTRLETKVAFALCIDKVKKNEGKLPTLLQYIDDNRLIKISDLEKSKQEILQGWDKENFLTEELIIILKKAMQ